LQKLRLVRIALRNAAQKIFELDGGQDGTPHKKRPGGRTTLNDALIFQDQCDAEKSALKKGRSKTTGRGLLCSKGCQP
jgi:hypothetical protein